MRSLTRLLRKVFNPRIARARANGGISPDFSYSPILPNPGPLAAEDRLVFLHLEKTAGTTAHHVLAQHFSEEEVCPEHFGNIAFWRAEDYAPYRFFAMHTSLRMIKAMPQPRKTLTFLRDPVERLLSHYNFWRSFKDDFVGESNMVNVRYAKSVDMRELLSPSSLAVLPEFWNLYAHRLAGDIHVSPSGKPWRDELEVLDTALANLANITTLGLTEYPAISFQRIAEDLGIPNRYGGERYNVTATNAETHPEMFELADATLDDQAEEYLERVTRLDRQIYNAAHRLFEDRLCRGITLGGVVPEHLRTERIDGDDAIVSDGQVGCIMYGPYCALPRGSYRATTWVRAGSDGLNELPFRVVFDVVSDMGRGVHAVRNVDITDLSSERFRPVSVEFTLHKPTSGMEFRLLASGQAGLAARRGVDIARL